MWDGTAWRIDSTLSAVTGGFNAITATGDSGLWAVGAQDTARTLTAQFHSGQWAVRPTPDVGLPDAQFGAVDARTPDDIWAVGQYQMVGNSSLAFPLTRTLGRPALEFRPGPTVILAAISG